MGERPEQMLEREYLLLVNLSQKCGALVMLPTKRLEVIIVGASVDESLKQPSVEGIIIVTRTVLIKNMEQCCNTVLTPGSLTTADMSSMNSLMT